MCVIIHLRKGILLPYKMFETATFNNPHGYGVVLKDDNRLEVKRECPEKGNDPEKIYKLLEKNKDVERFVHLRWKTQGNIDLSNTQPFPAYISDKRQVYFMHNGSLHDYKKKIRTMSPTGTEVISDDDSISDSRYFCETDLSDLLLRLQGENGVADIQDPVFIRTINKFWSAGSKGLLISNDQDPLLLSPQSWDWIGTGEFLTTKDKSKPPITSSVEIKFHASNNDYFKELKRGPVYDQRKRDEEERRAAERAANPTAVGSQRGNPLLEPVPLSSAHFERRYGVMDRLKDIMVDYDLYLPEGGAALSALTIKEWKKLIEECPGELDALLMQLTEHLHKVVEDNEQLRSKLDAASKRIEAFANAEKKNDQKAA